MTEIAQTLPATDQNFSFLDTESWLQRILERRISKNPYLLRQALRLAQLAGEDQYTPTGESCLKQGMMMAEILNTLKVDDEIIAAAILFSTAQYTDLKTEDIIDHLGEKVGKLIQDAKHMASISDLYHAIHLNGKQHQQSKQNIDNIRKMLLAMVDDIRVVLLKLAERLCILRCASALPDEKKLDIAKETLAIYAPLANRLGIAPIKLEMEDLAFNYLEPEQYHKIANYLKQSRLEREEYIQEIISTMENALREAHIQNFQVTGRAKHIYSIYKKMQRKQIGIEEIYDVSAIRILVDTVQDCYAALSVVHSLWQQISKEFDDYIATPKPNGYRSIHTAVIGPNSKSLEIQIRTCTMHEVAELGVAAHWVYKEGEVQQSNYEAKISWLRQVMAWQQEITADKTSHKEIREIFNDRVYVFTPLGDVLDLPQGATPLDFAYALHSGLGHACHGAKINGSIVPLTYQLKTGDHIEILKGKHPTPSRNWLSSSAGFLKTSRAKSKVLHWFKKQDYEKHLDDGRKLLDIEMRRLNAKDIELNELAGKLQFANREDLLAALGSGVIKLGSVSNALQTLLKNKIPEHVAPKITAIKRGKKVKKTDIKIQGIDNLLTNIANCCKPVPGEPIVGYITQGRGISIHRSNCHNIVQALKNKPEKILNVSWSGTTQATYPIDIIITAYDRPGLMRDISSITANENLTISDLSLNIDKKEGVVLVKVTTEVANLDLLTAILAKIRTITGVLAARRS